MSPLRFRSCLAAMLALVGLQPRAQVQDPRPVLEALVTADEADTVVPRLVAAARGAPDPLAEWLLAHADRLAARVRGAEALLDALAGAEDGLGGPRARHALLVLRARLLDRIGRREEAARLQAFAASPRELVCLGPVADLVGVAPSRTNHWLGVPLAPEFEFPRLDQDLQVPGGSVRPRAIPRAPFATEVEVPRDPRPGCWYALAQAEADQPLAVQVEVHCPGSFELFVNGERLASVDRSARPMSRRQHVPAALRAGVNHLLVKGGTDAVLRFGLRVLAANGTPAALRWLPASGGVRAIASGGDRPALLPRHPHAADAFPKGPARPDASLAHGLIQLLDGNEDEGVLALQPLLRQPPADPFLRLALAHALTLVQLLPPEIRRSHVRALLDTLGEGLATHGVRVLLEARALEEEDKREAAIRLLEQQVAAGRAMPAHFEALLRLQRGLKLEPERRHCAALLQQRFPGDEAGIREEMGIRMAAGDAAGVLALARPLLARHQNDVELARQVAELAARAGDRPAALAAAELAERDDPEATRVPAWRATLWRTLGDRDATLTALRTIAGSDTVHSGWLEWAGDRLLEEGEVEAAAAAWRRALGRGPARAHLRRALGELEGQDPLAAVAAFRRDADALAREYRPGPRDAGAPTTLVLDQMLVVMHDDGSRTEEVHQLRRINDLRGVEQRQEAHRAAAADDLVRVRTIAKDGTSFVPHRVEGSFAMPRLEPGAFVEECYREEHATLPGAPWRGATFHFRSSDEPYVLSELVVVVPAGHSGRFRTRNFAGTHEVQKLAGGREAHVYRLTDQDRLPPEPHGLAEAELVPVVTFGDDGTPLPALRAGLAAARGRSHPDPIVTARTAELVADVHGDTARARAIWRFVQESVADGRGGQRPAAILLTGKGDRFLLQVAMLRAAGVPLDFAQVAHARDEFEEQAPSLFLGDHELQLPAVRIAPRDGAPLWLFAETPRWFPLGEIPAAQMDAAAVLLSDGGGTLTRVPGGDVAACAGLVLRGRLGLDRDGTGVFEVEAQLQGEEGYGLAEQIRNLDANTRKLAARQVTGQVLPGWTQKEVAFTDLEPPGRPLRMAGVLHQRGALRPAGDVQLLSLPFPRPRLTQALGDRAERKTPLALRGLSRQSIEVRVEPGPQYRIARLPAGVQIRHMLFDYSLSFDRTEDGAVLVRRTLLQRPGTVPPERFAEWRELLGRIDQAEELNLQIVAADGRG
ncbi:MAG: hypothetical protein IT458_03565 [Planctomycetes bacterium]|nr:hypothetical protein [Planctomycetota bacterium]